MERGEIWHVSLGPSVGTEEYGSRRVIVVSAAALNAVSTPIIVPVTIGGGFARDHGFAVNLIGLGLRTQGVVLCHQVRALDLRHPRRNGRFTGERVPEDVMNDILARITALFTMDEE